MSEIEEEVNAYDLVDYDRDYPPFNFEVYVPVGKEEEDYYIVYKDEVPITYLEKGDEETDESFEDTDFNYEYELKWVTKVLTIENPVVDTLYINLLIGLYPMENDENNEVDFAIFSNFYQFGIDGEKYYEDKYFSKKQVGYYRFKKFAKKNADVLADKEEPNNELIDYLTEILDEEIKDTDAFLKRTVWTEKKFYKDFEKMVKDTATDFNRSQITIEIPKKKRGPKPKAKVVDEVKQEKLDETNQDLISIKGLLKEKILELKDLIDKYKTKTEEYNLNKTKEAKIEITKLRQDINDLKEEISDIKTEKSDTEERLTVIEGSGIDNLELYKKVKKMADETYSKPSAYKSGYIVKKYKELGGTYSGTKKNTGLTRWYKESWQDIGNKDYPVYRPTKRITKDTPLTASEISPSNLKKQIALKQKIKGTKNLPKFEGGELKVEPYSDYKKALQKAKKYLGKNVEFQVSTLPSKKYMVFNPETNKLVHFGQMGYEDFTKHNDKNRRQRYLNRATNIKGNWKDNKFSPNNLSIHILW
jgi:hypothetical protein